MFVIINNVNFEYHIVIATIIMWQSQVQNIIHYSVYNQLKCLMLNLIDSQAQIQCTFSGRIGVAKN